jgi:pimeloyl-ACP methyl ester carboxylesterase
VADRLNQNIRLEDGRAFGFAEYGDPAGKPVFYFHGAPSCRLDWAMFGDEAWARSRGVRFIAVDRPGTGLSDFQAGRRLVDWPDDVTELADALEIERFAVWGLSGGGPYAAVCAWKLPMRLTAAAIVSGFAPFSEMPGIYEQIYPTSRRFWELARDRPLLSRFLLQVSRGGMALFPGRVVATMAAELPECDRPYLQQSTASMKVTLRESLRSGARGGQYDAWLLQQPWGFPLEEVKVRVLLWQGESDLSVPVAMGRYLAERIPGCEATFFEGEGHLSLVNKHRDEILSALIG